MHFTTKVRISNDSCEYAAHKSCILNCFIQFVLGVIKVNNFDRYRAAAPAEMGGGLGGLQPSSSPRQMKRSIMNTFSCVVLFASDSVL